jgi:imidazolonepropionase-like amidohydrolase
MTCSFSRSCSCRLALASRFAARRALFLLGAISLLAACSKPPKPVLAITHVTVIDATGSPPQPDMTLLIADQRIAAIASSKSISVPRNAQIVDAAGKFLIPGLADMHVHLTGATEPAGSREFIIPLLLANGITTVRDMGGYLESLIPLRREIEQDKRLGPQITFAGPYLDGSPPSFQPSFVVTNAVEASEDVHALIQRGVDFIKVQSILSRDAYLAIANVCRREHITFVGHVPDRVTAAEASDAGQKSIEHLTCVLRACSKDEPRLMREQFLTTQKKGSRAQSHARQLAWQRELLAHYSEKSAGELIAKFVRNETWQVPTLILLRNNAYPTPESDPENDPRRKYVPHQLLETWQQTHQNQMKGITPQELALRADLLEKSMRVVAKMQLAGVHLMAGTDTTAPFVFPGSGLHEELALLVQSGLTPMQALQAATKNPAEFLGKLQTQGTIAPGKFADLLILDANPLAGIHNTQKIRAVILRGKLLARNDLDGFLAAAEKFASAN